jgi:pimeloyl-ACP methyl ester carboxylesterase
MFPPTQARDHARCSNTRVNLMKPIQRHLQFTVVSSAILLAACGGSDDEAGSNRGALVDTPVVLATLTAAQIDAGTASSGLQAISGKAVCDVKVVSLNYLTPGVKNDTTNSSGVLLIPTGTAAACTAPSALVAYAKGTDVQKPRTLASATDGETFLLTAIYAAQGYSVVATDYIGFAKSGYSFHPYLHADSEASAVLDSIRAARSASKFLGYNLSGKTMITGYSQGGHSSMAAHRAGEAEAAAEMNIVAGAHLAGPYNLSGSLSSPGVIAGYQFFIPYLITSWQKVYGTVYTDVKSVFKAPYSDYIESLLPNPTLDYTTLITTGKLPAGPSPTQARDALMQPAFVADVATSKTNGVYLAAVKNDLLGWTPKAKTLLCGGANDPTVPPGLHQTVMKADFDKRGVTTVTSVDVDASIQAAYGVGTPKATPTDPTSAAFATYFGNYHGAYEPPFCHQRAKLLFDTVK